MTAADDATPVAGAHVDDILGAAEHLVTCKLCGHHEAWTTHPAAQAAAVWHIYREHYAAFVQIVGDRPPRDRQPEELGRRYEDWERQ